MGLSGSLRAFVLLSLLAAGCRSAEPESEKVDIDNLADIINFFDDNYKQGVGEGVRQYAVAINIDKNQCKLFEPDHCNLPTNERAEDVKNLIYDRPEALYESTELIAAGTIKKKKETRHSEGILLNPPVNEPKDPSPMDKLLNQKKDGCVVFYTYNSPCFKSCTDINSEYNILNALENWSKRDGLKAFVFEKIWKHDENKTVLEKVFKAIAQYVPLYRCVPSDKCYECVQEGTINPACVQFQQTRHHHVG